MTDQSPTRTPITDVLTVAVAVSDQDRALAFYADTLGFQTRRDVSLPRFGRWRGPVCRRCSPLMTRTERPHDRRGRLTGSGIGVGLGRCGHIRALGRVIRLTRPNA
jgi:catechol 2,3-dioxygenase-like lactoylglutathione lyase family enzyme